MMYLHFGHSLYIEYVLIYTIAPVFVNHFWLQNGKIFKSIAIFS